MNAMTMNPRVLLLALLLPLIGTAQMIPNQSVKLEYDSRGNREIRKPWNSQTQGNKTDEDVFSEVSQAEGMIAYPNPTNNWVTLSTTKPEMKSQTIELLNATGQIVLTQQWIDQNSNARLNLEGLPTGLYHISVTSATGQRKTLVIIHQ